MERNLLTNVLTGLVSLGALTSLILALLYVNRMRDLRISQGRIEAINRYRAIAQPLAIDTVEYSRRNPAIDPLLQSFGIKPGSAPAQKPAPPAK